MKKKQNLFPFRLVPLLLMLFTSLGVWAQSGIRVTGSVTADDGEPIIGATVRVKGNPKLATVSDFDGHYAIEVPGERAVLSFSYVGTTTQEQKVGNRRTINVSLHDAAQLGEIVVVGYGQQKKASIVGAITQTDAKTLDRYSGNSSLGQALTGNLPGVITSTSTGMPGAEDPKIIIRTQTSWNNSDPLVLVDGIERPMNTVDIASVESISVLKDASATAVYGVKGANGVILITTKRGKEGKANVHAKVNTTVKVVSKLPEKYDSYDTFLYKNDVILREMPLNAEAWGNYKPMEVIDKYRHPANSEEWDRYPNVDWQKTLFNNVGYSYNTSVDISGGTKLVKYFAAIDFVHEGDIFKKFESGRGYHSGFGYNRVNLRSNLDFDLTKTTKFSMNLFGSNGVRHFPWGGGTDSNSYWASVYRTAPDAFRPVYSDGTYGYYEPRDADMPNSVSFLATSGDEKNTNTQITTDFILHQDLGFITKGLSVKGNFSYDNTMVETGRGINDQYNYPVRKWISPETGQIYWKEGEDYVEPVKWSTAGGSVNTKATYRKMYYSGQINYDRTFGRHAVTAMGLFSRERYARGSEFYHYREDWVFRTTYNWAERYFAEINGAYNGSEKFGSNNRFDFFPSFSAGWMITEEPFMKSLTWLDMLKVRASWGRIGDDNVGDRWLYRDTWAYGGNTLNGNPTSSAPYTIYTISQLGNPNVSWEKVTKKNLGFDYSFLGGLIAGSIDFFHDHRSDILISGSKRAIPSYFGTNAPIANLGVVNSHGYELVVRLNKVLANKMRLWANFNMTHGVNEVKFADDPELKAAYRKTQGYAIGQVRSYLDQGYITNWDELYGSTWRQNNNSNKLVGDYQIIDFNGDGQIDVDDQAPYKYTSIPQNTYSTTVGMEWKGFSVTLQFYGVTNVTREVTFPDFQATANVIYKEGSFYNAVLGTGEYPLPRWSATQGSDAAGTRYLYDGSFLRLKNAEIAYAFTQPWVRRLGLNQLRVYLNGDNLLLWTNLPDDRESNFSGGSSSGAYPTVRRFNLGLDLTF